MLRKSQMVILFLFLITESSYQKAHTQKDKEEPKPPSSKSDPRELSEALGEHRLGTTNLTIRPPPRKKEPITISNQFAGNNGRIHKLYYVIPGSGDSSHREKTHEVKVRLRARRHSSGDGGKRWRHRRQRRDLTQKWRVQRLKRELAGATLGGGDRKWSEPQSKHVTSVEMQRNHNVGALSSENAWRQMRDASFVDGTLNSAEQRKKHSVENGAAKNIEMWKDSRQIRDGGANYGDSHYSIGGTLTAVDHSLENRAPSTGVKTWRESRKMRDGTTSYADSHYSLDGTLTAVDTRTNHGVETPNGGNKVWTESRKIHDETTSYADSHYSVDGTLAGVDTRTKHDVEHGAPSNGNTKWRDSQQTHDGTTGYADYSVDAVDTPKKDTVVNEEPGSNKMWRGSQQMSDGVSDAGTKWREREPEREMNVKSLEKDTSDATKNWSHERQDRNQKGPGNVDRPRSESEQKGNAQAGVSNDVAGKKFEWRESKEKVIDTPDEDVDKWRKREPDSGAQTDMDVRWRASMRNRAPRDHKFVTKSQLKTVTVDRVMNDVAVSDQVMTEPPPVIKVYTGIPEEGISKIYRAAKNRDFGYSRTPTKRIIYYATLPEIIRRPASPEWFARHSGAFGQRGIGSSFSNSLLSPFPSGPGQGTADIQTRIQSALMDVRPPRDNLTPQAPQFTVVDIDRYPSLNDITSTNSVQSSGSPALGSGQSLSDSSGATEGPTSINSLHNNFISSLMTPLQMNAPFNGYQPAPYYPGPFPTRHHRFPLPMDGYRPYIAPPNGLTVPNTLGNLANYKIEHPSGFHNSGISNIISSTKYPYYYDYTSSRVDPLKNHLLFSPTWGAAGPPLYERLTPSTHSAHSVVIDSQSININAGNITTGNSTRITPPIVTNVTEHYESHE